MIISGSTTMSAPRSNALRAESPARRRFPSGSKGSPVTWQSATVTSRAISALRPQWPPVDTTLRGGRPRMHGAIPIPLVEDVQYLDQPFQRGQVVTRQEVVDVGQRGRHASRQRLVPGLPSEGVYPDHRPGRAMQPFHLAIEQAYVPPLPAVGEDDHDGAPGDAAAA